MKTFEEKWTAWIDDIGLRLKRKSKARNKSVPFCASKRWR